METPPIFPFTKKIETLIHDSTFEIVKRFDWETKLLLQLVEVINPTGMTDSIVIWQKASIFIEFKWSACF